MYYEQRSVLKILHVRLFCMYMYEQGRISNIGKLGTCLGRQLCRGSTPTKKKRKMWKTNFIHLLHSHLTLLQYKLIWCQNDCNFISFLLV